MLHLIPLLIPKPLHRAILRVVHFIRYRWWRLTRKLLTDVRVMAFGDNGRTVLLVRHSYGPDTWMLPGGALRDKERVLQSAARELKEETDCELVRSRLVAIYDHSLHGGYAISHIVAGPTTSAPRPDGREIIEAAFFPVYALPRPMAPQVNRYLKYWISLCAETDKRVAPARADHSKAS